MNRFILGDTLEQLKLLESNSVDLIITSPPYNLKNKGGDIKVNYDTYNDNMSNEEYELNQIEVLNECFRVLKDDSYMFYNHKNRYENGKCIFPISWLLKSNFNVHQEIIWNRKSGVDNSGNKFTPFTERIYWLSKGNVIKMKNNHFILSDIWELGKASSNNDHPAPFPISLPTRIIYSIFDELENKTILDPYNGSGTTGVVANFFNHNYIGIDISKEYLDKSELRINGIGGETREEIIEEIKLHKEPKKEYKSKFIKTNKQLDLFDI